MSKIVQISSPGQLSVLLKSHAVVVVDFYADWCGPCKAIAPVFESLANKHAKPNVVAFCKVNCDNNQDISQSYGVTAMPTFLVFRTASIHTTLKGADARGLTTAIETCIKSLPAGPSGKSLYATPGRTLGGSPSSRTSLNRPFTRTLEDWFNAIIAFLGLYAISLFSLDPYAAAEGSAFNVNTHPRPGMPGGGPRRLGGVGRVSPRGAPVAGCAGGSCG